MCYWFFGHDIYLPQDSTSEKDIKTAQDKLSKTFFYMMNNLELASALRYKNSDAKEYTYYSERINMFWISKNLATSVDILPKIFSDHNTVTLLFKRKTIHL